MPLGDYLAGLAFLAGVAGVVGLATETIVRRRLGHLTGVPRLLAWGLLASMGLLAVHLAPAVAGVLGRPAVAVTAGLVCGAVLLAVPVRPTDREPDPFPPAERRDAPLWLSRGLAGLAVAAIAVYVLAALRQLATVAVTNIDNMSFHFPGIARWIQTGSVWQLDVLIPLFPVAQYPHSGDFLFLAAVLPWDNDAFVRFVDVPFLGLLGLAVYAIARELRAPAAAAALFAAVVLAVRTITFTAVETARPDTILLAGFAIGVLFLLRHCRTGSTGDLVLGGLGLGLAFGTKWYGVSCVAIGLLAWGAATWLARRRPGRVLREGAALCGLVAAGGGFWLLRNLVESGNPLFPVKVAPFGLTLFDAPRDVLRERYSFTIASHFDDPAVWADHILPEWWEAMGLAGAVLGLALLLAAGLAAMSSRRGSRDGRPIGVLALSVAAILMFFAYTITPGTAQGFEDRPFDGLVGGNARYLTPALVLCGPLAAWAVGRLGRWGLVLELVGFAAVVDGIRRTFAVPTGEVVLVALGTAAAGLAVAGLVAAARRMPPPRRRWAVVAATGLAVAGAAALGQIDQRRFNEKRYVGAEPTTDWLQANAPAGHRVGVAGDWSVGGFLPVYSMFGPRLENRVEYVGPHHGWLRQYRTRDAFLAALRRGRHDLLLLGRGAPPQPRVREEAWARTVGFRPVAASERFMLLHRAGSAGR